MASGEKVRLFVSGDHDKDFILDSLNKVDIDFEITEICGTLTSGCLEHVIPWCERRGIPMSLHFPSSFDKKGQILLNARIIHSEEPDMILIYREDEDVIDYLMENGEESRSVQLILTSNEMD